MTDRSFRCALAAACAFAAVSASAAPAPAPAARLFEHRADERLLDSVRGGFEAPGGGLVVSFGVQRSAFVDGALVATAGDASTLLLVQRGSGNALAGGSVDATAAGTIVQNSLDNQKFQVVTTIDVVANSLSAYRGLNLQSMLRSSIVDSLRR